VIPTLIIVCQAIVMGVLEGAASQPPGPGATAGTQPTLTLAAAVAQARTSPGARAAALVVQGAAEAARTAGRPLNPLVEVRSENWGPRRDTLPLDLFAVVTQPIELAGKRAGRRRLAESERDLSDADLGSLRRRVVIDAARAYVAALRARALLDTLRTHREGLATLVDAVGRQVREGYTAESDLLKFRSEAARVDGDIARANLDLDRALAGLTIAMGSATPVTAGQIVEPATPPPPASTPEAIAAAIARHPEAILAAAMVERARQLTALERSRRVPDPAVSAGYKRTAGFDTAVLGVMVSLPLFDRNASALARATGQELSAVAHRDGVLRRLTTEADALARASRTIAARASLARDELLAPAEGVRRAARAAFREGAVDVLKLIDAERVYADVNRAAIDLRLDALLATIEARFALGEETIP
jgi:cobalt-zinc-cadmium efflux system outer membrane protein